MMKGNDMNKKLYRVTYYYTYFNRFGEKDFDFEDHWVGENALIDLQNDSRVDELEIHEEKDMEQ
jgi:hypothetical protein